MVDRHLPFRGATSDGEDVSVREVPLGYLAQLAGWENFASSGDVLLRTLGLGLSEDYRKPWRGKDAVVWRIAPDRVLIRSDHPLAITSTPDLAALDLSQARVRLRLEGPGTAGLLARLVALDFSERSFPVGGFAQTGMHHVGVLIDRLGQHEFEILIPTTWAPSLVGFVGAHLH
jgi:heterotetrameric sarcosine oxidase gamma subunit